jgi:hypothetical protein
MVLQSIAPISMSSIRTEIGLGTNVPILFSQMNSYKWAKNDAVVISNPTSISMIQMLGKEKGKDCTTVNVAPAIELYRDSTNTSYNMVQYFNNPMSTTTMTYSVSGGNWAGMNHFVNHHTTRH